MEAVSNDLQGLNREQLGLSGLEGAGCFTGTLDGRTNFAAIKGNGGTATFGNG
jgi:hypothetical protein